MQQLTAALAAPRLLRHARRALLLLGAAFAWWLLFSGGPAQADDGGSAPQALDPVAPVAHTTKAATDLVRSAPHRITDRLAATTRTAPKPVRAVVDRATAALEPALTRTTTALADTLDGTVERTVRPTLATATAAVTPVVAPEPVAPAPASARTVGRPHVPDAATAAPLSTAASLAVVDGRADGTIGQAEGPVEHAPADPTAPAAPAAPGGSTVAPAGPLAALGGLLIAPPAVRRCRRTGGRSWRRPDPAYAPGCSPD